VLPHPPYSLDLAPADFFFILSVKEMLLGLKINSKNFRTTWDGVAVALGADEFAAAFQRWLERSQKCLDIGSS